ncbi:hypothetical protein [Amycolatopsis lexingtonensis]
MTAAATTSTSALATTMVHFRARRDLKIMSATLAPAPAPGKPRRY